jgi:chitinase
MTKNMKSPVSQRFFLLCLSILLISSCTTRTAHYGADIYKADTSFKVVGYLGSGNFNRIDELELDKLTYLNLAFGNPDIEGNIICSDNAGIIPIVKKGHDAGLKVYISLAGGGVPDTTIWKSVLEPKNRTSFIKKILKYVNENNLDGVDVDIEWNLLPYIGESYNPFVIELREALHAEGKGITSALGAVGVHKAISQAALDAYDFINVMVYDKTGIWRPAEAGPHSPYSYAEEAIKFWTEERKIPASRITLGVPFYGFDFTPPARYIDFSEIISENPANAYRDSIGMKYYNGIPTIVQKTELAKNKLGGLMIWEIASDTKGDMSLLRALHQTLQAGSCSVATFYKDEDNDGFGNPAKPFQACTAPEGYVPNKDDADDTNSIKKNSP